MKRIFLQNRVIVGLCIFTLNSYIYAQDKTALYIDKAQPACSYKPPKEIIITEESIGNQTWATQNLDVVTFRNGDTIPEAKSDSAWQKASIEGTAAWCYYNNDPENGKKYGKLYNWHAVNDQRGLAPKGYHVPSKTEWDSLVSYLGGEEVAGKKLKSTEGWQKDGNGTNESNFSRLPGGLREGFGGYFRLFGGVQPRMSEVTLASSYLALMTP